MAATSTYPINGQPIVRGDPLSIQVDIARKIDDVKTPIDITGWEWWAHVRRSADATLVMEFDIDVVTPPGGTFPSRLLLSLTPDQTRLLKTGMVFDLEQITSHATPTSIRTWWSCSKLTILKDVSHEP